MIERSHFGNCGYNPKTTGSKTWRIVGHVFVGLVFAVAAHRYPFSKIALKNIDRLCLMADKCCIFAFQAWRSYLIVIFMMLLGITLRYSPVPRHFLAVIYATIGGALFLSSFHFYRRIWMVKIRKHPCIPSDDKAPKV